LTGISVAKSVPGEGNSGKLAIEVGKLGQELAKEHRKQRVIIDESLGIGCPVIALVTGINLGIEVTEPTMSGIQDMNPSTVMTGGTSGAICHCHRNQCNCKKNGICII
jgi:MinD superfamily P-loop ATPase